MKRGRFHKQQRSRPDAGKSESQKKKKKKRTYCLKELRHPAVITEMLRIHNQQHKHFLSERTIEI